MLFPVHLIEFYKNFNTVCINNSYVTYKKLNNIIQYDQISLLKKNPKLYKIFLYINNKNKETHKTNTLPILHPKMINQVENFNFSKKLNKQVLKKIDCSNFINNGNTDTFLQNFVHYMLQLGVHLSPKCSNANIFGRKSYKILNAVNVHNAVSVQKNLEKLRRKTEPIQKNNDIDSLIKEIIISQKELDKLILAQKDLEVNDFDVIKEYAALDRPRTKYYDFTSTFVPCCKEHNVPWRFLHKKNLPIDVTALSENIQNSFNNLRQTSDIDQKFLDGLEGKTVFIDRQEIPSKNANEILTIIQQETEDYEIQQLISICMHPDMLDVSWEGLASHHPEIKVREIKTENITYEIDQIDYDKYKIAITKMATLLPSQNKQLNLINKYGIRVSMIITKYANPEIRYSYYVE